MSIYFGYPASTDSNKSVSSAVADKGLALFRAKPCEVQVAVLPYAIQPGFACYSKNIPAFIEATLTGKVVDIGNRGYPIGAVVLTLPLTVPRLIYNFDKPPNDATIETLKVHSTMIPGKAKEKSFIMNEPTLESIRKLVKDHPTIRDKTPHINGTVNLAAMKIVFLINKILSAFLLTNGYAAFRHKEDVIPSIEVSDVLTCSKKRKVSSTSYVECVTNPSKHLDDEAMETDADATKESTPDPKTIRITRAKPTTIIDDKWGDAETIPNADGLYAPFVEELAVPENITVPNLIATYFLRSLAQDTHTMFDTMEQVRSAWGVISSTEYGLVVTHICKCIDIALQAQSMIYPIFHNAVYEGSVICGSGYCVNMQKKRYEPISYADLQVLVRDSSAHSKSIKRIASIVADKYDYDIVESMRELSNHLKGVKLDELQKQEIVKVAQGLSFLNSRYWSTTTTNVKQMLDHLMNADDDLPEGMPMHPKFLFSNDRTELVLSAFGYMAPTFMLPNGSKIKLDRGEPPKNLLVRTIAVETAILDMKYMVENGYITNNLQNISARHRDSSINGPDKLSVWKMLNQLYQGNKATNEDNEPTSSTQKGKSSLDDIWK